MSNEQSNGTNEPRTDAKREISRGAGIVAAFTMLSRVAGLVRDAVMFHFFGAGIATDAFVLAFTIPNVMRRFVAEGAMTIAFIPVYSELRENEGAQAARAFQRAVLGAILTLGPLLTIAGVLGARPLVYAFASGFANDPARMELTVELTRWLFPYVFLVSLLAWATGVLNAHRHFAAPAAAPALLNISIVTAMLALTPFTDLGIYAVVLGVLVGGGLQLAIQLPAMRRRGVLVWPKLDFRAPGMVKLAKLLLPQLFGLAVYQINIVVLRQLASQLPPGNIGYYYNADRLMQLALGVFAIAIATAALPAMSDQAARGAHREVAETWNFAVRLTNFITIPAALGLIAVATPIVATLYMHGKFTWADVEPTALTTMAFAPGLIAVSLVRTTVQVFFALEDTKTPVYVAAVTMVTNLVLGWLLLGYGVHGLAMSFTLSVSLQAVILVGLLQRRLGALGFGTIVKRGLGQFVLAGLAVAAAYGVTQLGNWPAGLTVLNGLALGGAIGVAVLIYGGGALLLRLPEADPVKEQLLGKVMRRLRR